MWADLLTSSDSYEYESESYKAESSEESKSEDDSREGSEESSTGETDKVSSRIKQGLRRALSSVVWITIIDDTSLRRLGRGVKSLPETNDENGGTGFCVQRGDQRWVMTNNHVVTSSTIFYVRLNGQEREFQAQVYETTANWDLAVLTVDDEAFWKDAVYLKVGAKGKHKINLPRPGEEVFLPGFPMVPCHQTGIRRVTINRGNVTRFNGKVIETVSRGNQGNSGGPLLNARGELLGVHFAGKKEISENPIENDENTQFGLSIPAYVVTYFLNMLVADQRYQWITALDEDEVTYVNSGPAAREFFGEVPQGVHCQINDTLGKRDLVTHFDGMPLNNLGLIQVPGSEQWVPNEVFREFRDSTVKVHYTAFATKKKYETEVSPTGGAFSPSIKGRQTPTRSIFLGGYLFFDPNANADDDFGFLDSESECDLYEEEVQDSFPIVYRSVPHESTKGNMWSRFSIVKSCNGKKIYKLGDLLEMAEEYDDENPFLIINCQCRNEFRTICVDKRTLEKDDEFIQDTLGTRR